MAADVFSLPTDLVPSRTLVKNIWLTFNLLGNYIGNKNLKPDGRPEQFVAWLDAVRVAYPTNPYMLLFCGLGRVLMGQSGRAEPLFGEARAIVDGSPNWQYRFSKFGLSDLLTHVPLCSQGVYERPRRHLGRMRTVFLSKGFPGDSGDPGDSKGSHGCLGFVC